MSAPAETPIGDESAVAAPSRTFHSPRDGEHLAHAGPPLGPFVTDHHHSAWFDGPGQDRFESRLLPVEDAGNTLEVLEVETGNLHHPAGGRQRTPKDRETAVRVERVSQGMDHLAIGRRWV